MTVMTPEATLKDLLVTVVLGFALLFALDLLGVGDHSSTAVVEQRQYSDAERRQAMAVYAFVSGRKDAGEALLADAELEIPWNTIRTWVNRHRDDYEQIKSEVDEHARTVLADGHRRLASLAISNEEKALEQMAKLLDEGKIKPRELPKLIKEHAIVSGIHTEKSELLSGRPTSRVASDLGDIEAALKVAGIEVIQGTATEMPDHDELGPGEEEAQVVAD